MNKLLLVRKNQTSTNEYIALGKKESNQYQWIHCVRKNQTSTNEYIAIGKKDSNQYQWIYCYW